MQLYIHSCFSPLGKDGGVGVPEQTLVVPDRDPLRPGALLDHMSSSVNDAVSTRVGGNVAAAEEEAVGDVGRAGAGGEVVKAVGCVAGVGGENRQEVVEVCLVGAVWGEGTGCGKGCVWAVYGEESWIGFDYYDEAAEQGNCVNKQRLTGHFVGQVLHA
ncbi:hypothetical protein RHSIM_Rhsim13G0161100 [Rhododendron simsii]|uniref:Uncharacterized protein n=1 Tax=Rhododendron simsii TaxID=118357 RepID=A0A834G0I5_RHOSS|nr:hypothetical protein RHSIM_Rhsim13G0161100 [Rhododendron simsii]